MLLCIVYTCSEPRSRIPTLSERVASHPRRPNALPSPYSSTSRSPYTLPSSVSCKSCICHSCGNCPGCGDTLPVLEESARSRRRGLVFHSSSFFSHSCALFCTLQNSTLFFSSDCALFVQKHPGGVPLSFQVTHIWYSGRPKMIARRPLLAQNITRKRKSTP